MSTKEGHAPSTARSWGQVARSRLALILALSLLVHLIVITDLHLPDSAPVETMAPLSATLVPQPPAPQPTPAKPPPKPAASPPARSEAKPASSANPPAPVATSPPVIASDAPDASATVPSAGSTDPQARAGDSTAGTTGNVKADAKSAPEVTPAPPATPGQSAQLRYDVIAKDPKRDANQAYAGSGVLQWRLDGAAYSLDFSIDIVAIFLHFRFLQTQSSGSIDAAGLSPHQYSETQRNRAPGSVDVAAAAAGRHLQDRTSVLMQIGAMLHADSSLAAAGREFAIDVIGTDGSVETWQFRVVGDEPMKTDAGSFSTVHVTRVLRPGSHDRNIEVWLAPERADYPVRILYTEPNQSYVDLRLAAIS